MIGNCANKDNQSSLKIEALTATLHNCHFVKNKVFIPLTDDIKEDLYSLVVYCGLRNDFGAYCLLHSSLSFNSKVRNFLITKRVLNKRHGLNLNKIYFLHTQAIVKTDWVYSDELDKLSV